MARSCLVLILTCLSVLTIRAEEALPQWIWPQAKGADQETVYFRKAFKSSARDTARVYAACDNELTLYVNGKQVAESTAWETPSWWT